MGNYGIAAVYNLCIIPAFIEHAHIQAQNVGDIDSPSHASFIGADYHHVVGINLQILLVAEKVFDELVGGLYGFKTVERDGILHSGIVGIKGYDVVHTHFYQFLKSDGTVQGFAAGAFVLSAFI